MSKVGPKLAGRAPGGLGLMTKQPNRWSLGNNFMVCDATCFIHLISYWYALINATIYLVANYTIQLIDTIIKISLLTSAQATKLDLEGGWLLSSRGACIHGRHRCKTSIARRVATSSVGRWKADRGVASGDTEHRTISVRLCVFKSVS